MLLPLLFHKAYPKSILNSKYSKKTNLKKDKKNKVVASCRFCPIQALFYEAFFPGGFCPNAVSI